MPLSGLRGLRLVLQSSTVYLCTAEIVTVWLHAGPVSPPSTDSANSKAAVIRSGSDTSSSDEEESLPSPGVTPCDTPAKTFSTASPTSSDSGSYEEEDVLTSTDAEPGNKSTRAFTATSPASSLNSLFSMTPGSPPSLGLGSPFAAGSPLSLSALDNFDDLLIDEDGFEAISPLPALTAAASPPRLGTTTLAVYHSPPRGITPTTWATGQTPTSPGSNAGTLPRRHNEPSMEMIFSPLPLVGSLAAQRLPADGTIPSSPLQLTAAPHAEPLEGVQGSACCA